MVIRRSINWVVGLPRRLVGWYVNWVKKRIRGVVVFFISPVLLVGDAAIYTPYRLLVGATVGDFGAEVEAVKRRWMRWAKDMFRGARIVSGIE